MIAYSKVFERNNQLAENSFPLAETFCIQMDNPDNHAVLQGLIDRSRHGDLVFIHKRYLQTYFKEHHIRANPNVALVYRSATTPALQFHGRARIAADEAERTRVFESAPEREQASDPERKGVAVIVDLDRIEGVLKFGPDGPEFVRLAR